MPAFPRNPFLPPNSLNEFLSIYDFDICDHAGDACVVMASLVSATSYMAMHERKIRFNPKTADLVVEIKLTLTIQNANPRKATEACAAGDPMPNIWGASAPRPPAAPIKGLAAGGRGAGAQRTPARRQR